MSHSTQTSLYSHKQPTAATAAGAPKKNFTKAVVTDIWGGLRHTQLMEYKKKKKSVLINWNGVGLSGAGPVAVWLILTGVDFWMFLNTHTHTQAGVPGSEREEY